MFSTQGLLQHVTCPDHKAGRCDRLACPFSHPSNLTPALRGKKRRITQDAERDDENDGREAAKRKSGGVAALQSEASSSSSHAKAGGAVSAFDRLTSAARRRDPLPASSSQTVAAVAVKRPIHTHNLAHGTATAANPKPDAAGKSPSIPTPHGAPTLLRNAHPSGCKVPFGLRESSLRTFYTTFTGLYAPVVNKPRDVAQASSASDAVQTLLEDAVQRLAAQDTLATESDVFNASNTNAVTYRNSIRTTLVGLVRRQKESGQGGGGDKTVCMYALGMDTRARIADSSDELEEQHVDDAAAKQAEMLDTVLTILRSSALIGTPAEVRVKQKALEERSKGRLTIDRLERHSLLASDDQLLACQYPVPADASDKQELRAAIASAWGEGSSQHSLEGQEVACGRCSSKFLVRPIVEGSTEAQACCFHWGKRRYVHDVGRTRGPRTPRWTCCGASDDGAAPLTTANIAKEAGLVASGGKEKSELASSAYVSGGAGCVRGPHVFKEEECELLHRREAFKSTAEVLKGLDDVDGQGRRQTYEVLAFDCELVYTTAGMSLARLTVLDESGKPILDRYVRPRCAILDFNTRFSGIRSIDIPGEESMLEQARRDLVYLMRPDSVLVGHGLENDLKAVRLVHTRIIDSAVLYPHAKGLPFHMSLRDLTRIHLGRYIQLDTDDQGHDAEEDARAALELIRLRYSELAASGSSQAQPVTVKPVNPFRSAQTGGLTTSSVAPAAPQPPPPSASTNAPPSIFLPKVRRRK